MKYTYLLPLTLLCACDPTSKPANMPSVTALVETEAVSAQTEDDAADDPSIWHNAANPEKSLIIGSNKKKGIDVYSLDGSLVANYEVGKINNVDVRNDVQFQDTALHIVGGSNRTTNAMDFWSVDPASGALNWLGSIPSEMPDVYGFCLYKNPETNEGFAAMNSKTGEIGIWKLGFNGKNIAATRVNTYQLQGQVEGMVADDALNTLYVGLEDGGIYRFNQIPNGPAKGLLIKGSTEENSNIKYDIEGLAIYRTEEQSGYLIASSQGNNSYAVFERSGDNSYLGSFVITAGIFDGVEETDGIEATHIPLGPDFPKGAFICQDGYNYDGETKVSQNFKVVDWREIEQVIQGFGDSM
jgi:3-phytase